MQTHDDIHSSPGPEKSDLGNLIDRIYFKSLYLNSDTSNKKRTRSIEIFEQSLPESIGDRLPEDLLDALWRARAESLLKDAVTHLFVSPFVFGDILSGSNTRKKDLDKLPLEIVVKLKKRLNSRGEMRLDLTRRAFVHYFLQFINQKDEAEWQKLCGLMLCAPLLGIDSGISSQDFCAAISDDENCRALLDTHEDLIAASCALGALKMAEHVCSEGVLDAGLEKLKEIKDYDFDSIDDLIKFDALLHKHYLPFKREHQQQLSSLKRKLAPYLEAEKYEEFLNASGWNSAQKLPLIYKDACEFLLAECMRLAPARISGQAMLADLEKIQPPLRSEDRSLIEAEADSIEKGELEPGQSWAI